MRYIYNYTEGEENFPEEPLYHYFPKSVIVALARKLFPNPNYLSVFELESGAVDIHPDFRSFSSEMLRLSPEDLKGRIDSDPELMEMMILHKLRGEG